MTIQLLGHRGARGLFPENTMAGFQAAIALGMESFELDVAVTADGVAVVHHDPALNPDIARGPDGAWVSGPGPLIHATPYAELRRYDLGRLRPGSPTAERFPAQQAMDGARLPRLEEVLRLPARFLIELKLFPAHRDWTVSPERMAEFAVEAAEAAGALARCTFQSFDWRAPRYLRRTRPELALSWLSCPVTEADAHLWWGRAQPPGADGTARAIVDEGGGTWAPDWEGLSVGQVRAAQALGLGVVPWTVNGRAAMEGLAAWGVDGLITDHPDRALAPPLRFCSRQMDGSP